VIIAVADNVLFLWYAQIFLDLKPFCFLTGAERATNGVLPETISARRDGAIPNNTGAVLSLKAASHICILETSATPLP
jgi:hypothetical protein